MLPRGATLTWQGLEPLEPHVLLSASVEWVHLSSALADLPAPAGNSGQTAAQVLDIDKDGRDDFVVTLRSVSDSILWYRRDAGGWTQFLIGEGVSGIEAGGAFHDVDGDGDLDLVFGDDSNGNKIRWWENPYPNFSPETPWACHVIKDSGGNKDHDMVFGDFDGDGEVELVCWNQGARQLLLFEKPADPKAVGPWPVSVIYSWSDGQDREGLAAADINLDGKLDIVGGGCWFEHAGGTSFIAHVIDDSMASSRVAVGPLKEGGRVEVVLRPGESDGPLKWYEWTGSTWQGRTLLASVTHGHSLQTGDIDGDGHLDILVGEMGQWSGLSSPADNPEAKVWVFYGDGGGNFTPQVVSPGQGVHEAALGDLDGDGDLDILGKPFRHNIPRVDVWLNNGSGQIRGFDQVVIDPDGIVYQRQVGDLDGDGRNDVVGVQEDELVWFSPPDFAGQTLVDLGAGGDWPLFRADDLKLADIDDDGDLDVVTRIGDSGDDNGKMVWFENPRPGSGVSGTWAQHDIGANGYVKDIVVEDFDGDGRLDVVARQRAQTQVWFQDGPHTWVKKAIDHVAKEGMDVGDLDGDNDPDIVLNGFWLETPTDARAGNYDQHVIDSQWFTQSGGWQVNSCRVVVADIDGDGRPDVVLSHSGAITCPAHVPVGSWAEYHATG